MGKNIKNQVITEASARRYQKVKQVSFIAGLTNLGLGLIKVFLGLLGNSSALVADGVHSFSDIIADAFVIIAARFSQHEADSDHPYGHRRIETIGTFVLGVFLIFIGVGLGYEAAMKLWHHVVEKPEFYTLGIAIFSVMANEVLFFYSLKIGKKIRSELLIANAYHSRGDSLTSIIVLIGLIGAQLGFPFLDEIAAILVAVYLMKIGVEWGIKALYELSDAGLSPEVLDKIQDLIHQTPGVLHSHRLRTRKMADQVFLDVHIQVDPYLSVSEGHYIGEAVRMGLGKNFPELFDITVHIDIDEHVEGIPTSLPLSPEFIRDKLKKTWKTFLKSEDFLGVRVHYFSNSFEVEVRLSCKTIKKFDADFEKKLIQSASEHGIKVIGFLFESRHELS